jgi:hypothetical protein
MIFDKAVALAATAITLSLIQDAPQTKKPVVERPFRIEARGAAATFEELWSSSDVVIEGIVEGEQPADYDLRGTQRINTMYTVRIVARYRVGKHLTSETESIRVRRRGGIRDVGTHLEAHFGDTFPPFKQGEHYVMFLRETEWYPNSPHNHQGIYYYGTTYEGPDSFLKVESSGLRTSARTQLAKTMAALSLEALRGQLRRAASSPYRSRLAPPAWSNRLIVIFTSNDSRSMDFCSETTSTPNSARAAAASIARSPGRRSPKSAPEIPSST